MNLESKPLVLIIEDERQIRRIVRTALEEMRIDVAEAGTAKQGLVEVGARIPDLLILDLGLPDMDGVEVIRNIRNFSDIPIIVLSARTQEREKVAALDAGADDYLTKPFDNRELLARIKAHLRRSSITIEPQKQASLLNNGELSIYSDERMVLLDGKEIHLTPKEFELLFLLASNLEQVFPRDTLLEKIWGYDYYGDTRTVDMHVQRIRRKIDTQGNKYIQTVFGIGYKMRKL